MKLNRKQELALIDIGLQQLLKTLGGGSGNYVRNSGPKSLRKNPVDSKGRYSHKWSAERRKKFSETMKKKWARGDYKNKKK